MAEMVADQDDEQAKKMPYFHRELSASDQEVLAASSSTGTKFKNLQPQKIETADAALVATAGGDGKLSTASAWNAAQSWEERDASKICLEQLTSILDASEVYEEGLAGLGITILSVTDVSGSASVTHVRGT